ncbi:hypothetical protein ACR9MS_01875 [Helicobacter pylori]|uniref:hypothetical protein n=1 Tax=Helicobacter pylori TaxID=210 RepID=UPI001237A220|nr:hypothetical protein [Helicobacter pylori]KAA6511986.1 hypothetical protein EPC80_07860 [Helicobacter pylori]
MSEKPTIKIVNKKGIRGRENKRFFIPHLSQNPPKNRKNRRAKPLKPPRKFKILSFRGVFLKNLGFL